MYFLYTLFNRLQLFNYPLKTLWSRFKFSLRFFLCSFYLYEFKQNSTATYSHDSTAHSKYSGTQITRILITQHIRHSNKTYQSCLKAQRLGGKQHCISHGGICFINCTSWQPLTGCPWLSLAGFGVWLVGGQYLQFMTLMMLILVTKISKKIEKLAAVCPLVSQKAYKLASDNSDFHLIGNDNVYHTW